MCVCVCVCVCVWKGECVGERVSVCVCEHITSCSYHNELVYFHSYVKEATCTQYCSNNVGI